MSEKVQKPKAEQTATETAGTEMTAERVRALLKSADPLVRDLSNASRALRALADSDLKICLD